MRPWWREEPLNDYEAALVQSLMSAHAMSTLRPNISTGVLLSTAQGSGNYLQAIAATLLSFGERTGPVIATYDLLGSVAPQAEAERRLGNKQLIPGWGNSFVKGKPDPNWAGVIELVHQHKGMNWAIASVQRALNKAGKPELLPNPSCFTAATAHIVGIPRDVVPWLGVAARLPVWTRLFVDEVTRLQQQGKRVG